LLLTALGAGKPMREVIALSGYSVNTIRSRLKDPAFFILI
jgi:hypothetical protein